jgi:O-antigen/teichoic acid export membrane protein
MFAAYVLPAAASLHSAGREVDVEAVYVRASTIAFAVGAPVIGIMAVAPSTLARLILGTPAANGTAVFRILAVAYAVNGVLCLGGVVLQGIGDVWELARAWAIVLVVTVAADAILVPTLGPLGAAIGTLIALVAFNATSAYLLYTRHGITPFRGPLLLTVGTAGLATLVLALTGGEGDVVWVVVVGAVVAVTVGATAWWVGSDDWAHRPWNQHVGAAAKGRGGRP